MSPEKPSQQPTPSANESYERAMEGVARAKEQLKKIREDVDASKKAIADIKEMDKEMKGGGSQQTEVAQERAPEQSATDAATDKLNEDATKRAEPKENKTEEPLEKYEHTKDRNSTKDTLDIQDKKIAFRKSKAEELGVKTYEIEVDDKEFEAYLNGEIKEPTIKLSQVTSESNSGKLIAKEKREKAKEKEGEDDDEVIILDEHGNPEKEAANEAKPKETVIAEKTVQPVEEIKWEPTSSKAPKHAERKKVKKEAIESEKYTTKLKGELLSAIESGDTNAVAQVEKGLNEWKYNALVRGSEKANLKVYGEVENVGGFGEETKYTSKARGINKRMEKFVSDLSESQLKKLVAIAPESGSLKKMASKQLKAIEGGKIEDPKESKEKMKNLKSELLTAISNADSAKIKEIEGQLDKGAKSRPEKMKLKTILIQELKLDQLRTLVKLAEKKPLFQRPLSLRRLAQKRLNTLTPKKVSEAQKEYEKDKRGSINKNWAER